MFQFFLRIGIYTVFQKMSQLWQSVVSTFHKHGLILIFFKVGLNSIGTLSELYAYSTFLVSSLLLTLFSFKWLRVRRKGNDAAPSPTWSGASLNMMSLTKLLINGKCGYMHACAKVKGHHFEHLLIKTGSFQRHRLFSEPPTVYRGNALCFASFPSQLFKSK